MNGHFRGRCGILGVIGPGIGAVAVHGNGFKSDGRIVGAVKTFGTFLSDEHAPRRVAAAAE